MNIQTIINYIPKELAPALIVGMLILMISIFVQAAIIRELKIKSNTLERSAMAGNLQETPVQVPIQQVQVPQPVPVQPQVPQQIPTQLNG